MKEKDIQSQVRFTVLGKPVAKQRPKFGKGRVYTPGLTKQYEEAVGWAARGVIKEPFAGPVSVTIDAYIHRKMDCDNIAKSILDGMNGICYQDDDQVIELTVKKHKARDHWDQRAEIEVKGL